MAGMQNKQHIRYCVLFAPVIAGEHAHPALSIRKKVEATTIYNKQRLRAAYYYTKNFNPTTNHRS